jgi:hypothetical protein
MIGYAVYMAGKPVAKRVVKARAKGKETAVSEGRKRIPKKAIVAAVGAVGALAVWRRRRSKGDQTEALES